MTDAVSSESAEGPLRVPQGSLCILGRGLVHGTWTLVPVQELPCEYIIQCIRRITTIERLSAMNISKRKKTVVGSLAGLLLLGGIASTGVAAANAANNTPPTSPASSSTQSEKNEPQEVKIKGSISVTESATEESEAAETAKLAKLAKVDEKGANAAAVASVTGSSVVSTSLDDEDGFLVYEVTVKDKAGAMTEVIVDAGNAKVLASEAEGNEAAEGPESSNGADSGSSVEAPDVQDATPGATTGK